jgi:hypothetical protein
MIIEVTSPAVAVNLAVAVKAHVRQVRASGYEPPRELDALAAVLVAFADTATRDGVMRRDRARALSAARSRRYRERKRREAAGSTVSRVA